MESRIIFGRQSTSCGKWKLWSNCADAQADLSFRWAHRSFCWFCRAGAHISFFVIIALMKQQTWTETLLSMNGNGHLVSSPKMKLSFALEAAFSKCSRVTWLFVPLCVQEKCIVSCFSHIWIFDLDVSFNKIQWSVGISSHTQLYTSYRRKLPEITCFREKMRTDLPVQ